MVALFYLPVTSPLVCAGSDAALLSAWVDARPAVVVAAAEHAAQFSKDPVSAALKLQTCADVFLLNGQWDEADRYYRRSMRRLVEPRDIDTFSSRVAGYQSLFHNRLETAAGCFERLSMQGNSAEVRLEALLVLALIFHHASLFAEAHADLSRMADLAIAAGLAPWLSLAHTAFDHFAALAHVHSSRELDGHVEWRTAPSTGGATPRLAKLSLRETSLRWDSDVALLLAQRSDHVWRLGVLSDPAHLDTDAWIGPQVVSTWGATEPEATQPQARIEMAMAALSTRRAKLAFILINPLLDDYPIPEPLDAPRSAQARASRRAKRARSRSARSKRMVAPAARLPLPAAAPWPPLQPLKPRAPANVVVRRSSADENAVWRDAPIIDRKAVVRPLVMAPLVQDYIYAMSRLRVQQGLHEEGAEHYRNYLGRALGSLGRAGASLRRSIEPHDVAEPHLAQKSRQQAVSTPLDPIVPLLPPDDVTRRLPGRYLEAYRFMLEHLASSDLSLRDVASQVGLSERTLQVAFKRYLDESPRDVLRRKRMEKIHEELLLLSHSRANVMEVAARHGVPNRAALLNGYRKYYAETPSDSVVAAALAAALAEPEPEPGPVVSQAEVAGSP